MNELTPAQQLDEALSEEDKKLMISTKHDLSILEDYARQIIKSKDISVTQRLHHLKKRRAKLGLAGSTFTDNDLRTILGESV